MRRIGRRDVDASALDAFLDGVGRRVRDPVRLYIAGGAEAVILGIRPTTLDIDVTLDADDPQAERRAERVVEDVAERVGVVVEWSDPTMFLPIPRAAALKRSPWHRTVGQVRVHQFDLVSVALGKIGRGTERDLADVDAYLDRGLIRWPDVETLWRAVRGESFRGAAQSRRLVVENMERMRGRLRARGWPGVAAPRT